MSVDFFWRRVNGGSLDELSPKELGALVPYWSDAEFEPLCEAGMVMGVARNGYLMHFALTSGEAASGGVARLPVFGGEQRVGARRTPSAGGSGHSCVCCDPTTCGRPRRSWTASWSTS